MKKKWKLIAVLVVVLSLVGAYDAYRYLTQSRYQEVKTAIEPNDYEFIANRQGLVISWKSVDSKNDGQNASEKLKNENIPLRYGEVIHGKHYLSTESYQLVHESSDKNFDVNKLSLGEFWKIQVYDTSTKNLSLKEYDLIKAVKNYDDQYSPIPGRNVSFYTYNNQEYRTLPLQKTGVGTKEGKWVLFNMSNGRIEDFPKGTKKTFDKRLNYNLGLFTNLKVYYSDDINSFNSIHFTSSVVKQSLDWRLKDEYPKAYDLMTKQGGQLYLLTDKTDPKLLSDIYSLLIPKDKQLFDNLTVYGSITKDGQDHVVNSYEEFISVLKLEEQDSK